MKKITRRAFIKVGAIAGVAATVRADHSLNQKPAAQLTPSETTGPFYPLVAQKDKDFDLTMIEGRPGRATGEVIVIEGRVIDTNGQNISDAIVDLWQACASGKYNHPYDPNPAPVDPNFQGWAIVPGGSDGGFRFKTIMPGTYPAAPGWTRPPHIHFKISRRGYVELITQMYFAGHPLNEKDLLLKRKSEAERPLMTAIEIFNDPKTFQHQFVLQKA